MIYPFGTVKTIQMVDYPSWRTVALASECNCFLVPQDFLDKAFRGSWSGCAGIWVSLGGFLKEPNDLAKGFLRIKDDEGNNTRWARFFTSPPSTQFEYEDTNEYIGYWNRTK